MTGLFDDGRFRLGVGIEDTFVPQTSPGHRRLEEYELTQHYEHLDEDLDLAAGSGASIVRYGLPWYRLNPEPGRYVWDWADRAIDGLLARGLDPVVDLVHYGTPTWLDNQFVNQLYPDAVADYAAAVAARYGDRVRAWTPLNEPQWTARLCGESATWPPALRGDDGYLRVMTSICRGIVLTQQAIAAASALDPTFVHVEATFRYDVAPGTTSEAAELLAQRRFLALDLVTGRVDAHHLLAGYLDRHGAAGDLDWFAQNAVRPGVLGLNYYPMWSTLEYAGDGRVGSERDDGVAGLEDVLRVYGARYGVPLMVSETSFEGSEAEQVAWLESSVGRVLALRDELPIVGYVWWPLFDQVKWQYREGDEPLEAFLHRIGLVALVPDDVGRLDRRPTPVHQSFLRIASAVRELPGAATARAAQMKHTTEKRREVE